MNPKKLMFYLSLVICVSVVVGLLLNLLFINKFDAFLLSFLTGGVLFLLGLAVTRNEVYSMILPAVVVLILPFVSLNSLRETDDFCEVIGRYQESRVHSKGSHSDGSEQIQIKCPDGVFERQIWMSERYDLRVGEKIGIMRSFTGLKRL